MPVEKQSRHILSRPSRRPPSDISLQRDLHEHTRTVSLDHFLDALLDAKTRQSQFGDGTERLSALADDPVVSKALAGYRAVLEHEDVATVKNPHTNAEERRFCALVNAIAAAAPRPSDVAVPSDSVPSDAPLSVSNDVVFASTLPRPQGPPHLHPVPSVIALRSADLQPGKPGATRYPKKDLKWSQVLLCVEFEQASDVEESNIPDTDYQVLLDDSMDYESPSPDGIDEKNAWLGSGADISRADALPQEAIPAVGSGFPGLPVAAPLDLTEADIVAILHSPAQSDDSVVATEPSTSHYRIGRQPWPPSKRTEPMSKEEGEKLMAAAQAKALAMTPTLAQLFGGDTRALLDAHFAMKNTEERSGPEEHPAVRRLATHATHVLATTRGTRVHALGLFVKRVSSDGLKGIDRAAEMWYYDPSGAVRTSEAVRIPTCGDDKDGLARFAQVVWTLMALDREGWGVLPSSVFGPPIAVPGDTVELPEAEVASFPPLSLQGATRHLKLFISKDTGPNALREQHDVTLVVRGIKSASNHPPARGLVGRHGCVYRARIAEMTDRRDASNMKYQRDVGIRFEWRTVAREVERQKTEARAQIDYMNAVLDRKMVWRLSKGLRGRLCPRNEGVGAEYDDRVLVMTVVTPFVDMITAMRTRELFEEEMCTIMTDCMKGTLEMRTVAEEGHGDVAPNHMMVQAAMALTPAGVKCIRGFMTFFEYGPEYDECMEEGRRMRAGAMVEILAKMGVPVREGALKWT